MEEKQLDFNAPLLSVRRHAGSSSPNNSIRNRGVEGGRSSYRELSAAISARTNLKPPVYNSGLRSGPVRDPGTVPFVWEEIPGKPKDGSDSVKSKDEPQAGVQIDSRPLRHPPMAPKLHLPVVDSVQCDLKIPESSNTESVNVSRYRPGNSVRVFGRTNGSPLQREIVNIRGSSNCSKEKSDEEDADAFCDALETLSVAGSSMLCGSVSGVSALDGQDMKQDRTCDDPQTRSFMMDRFLPAAKAMASESPVFVPKKHRVMEEQKKPSDVVRKIGDSLTYQPKPYFVQQYAIDRCVDDEEEEEESFQDEDDEYPGCMQAGACGMIPWRLKNSIGRMSPALQVPRMKPKKHSTFPLSSRKVTQHTRSNGSRSTCESENELTWREASTDDSTCSFPSPVVRLHELGRKPESDIASSAMYDRIGSNRPRYSSESHSIDEGSFSSRRSFSHKTAVSSPSHEGADLLGLPKSGSTSRSNDFDVGKNGPTNGQEIFQHRSKASAESLNSIRENTLYVENVDEAAISIIKPTSIESSTGNDALENDSRPILNGLVTGSKEATSVSSSKLTGQIVGSEEGLSGRTTNESVHHFKPANMGETSSNPLQATLPPPLPKSPSESWLFRALPQGRAKKKTLPKVIAGVKWESIVKSTKVDNGHLRFSEELTQPRVLES